MREPVRRITIVSVNVGTPEVLDVWPDKVVMSAIRKRPVAVPSLLLDEDGLEGDRQADTRRIAGVQVHGGPSKALYAYPSEHFTDWIENLGQQIGPAAFGENLTIRGITEAEACIGDVWRWGDAVVQISQPRGPCYKLSIYRGDERVVGLMNDSGRTGWYLRVLEAGRVPTQAPITIVERHRDRVSVLDVHRAWQRRDDGLRELLDVDALAEDFKQAVRNRLARRRPRSGS